MNAAFWLVFVGILGTCFGLPLFLMWLGGGYATVGFSMAAFELFGLLLWAVWKSPTLSLIAIILGLSS